MKRIRLFLIGLFAACLPMLMAPSGGFPSLPTFQAAYFTGQRPSVLKCVTASCVVIGATPTGATGAQISVSNASAGLNAKVWDEYVDNGGIKHYRLINDALGAATDWLTVTRTAHTSAQLAYLTPGGTILNLPKFSFAEYSGSAGSCTNNSGVTQTQNMGACVRNSVGNYTISFTTAYAGRPVCLANNESATTGVASVTVAQTSSVTVQVVNTAFAALDGPVFISCQGF